MYYSVSMDFKISANFQSIGGNVTFGRDAKPKETREQLAKDVEYFTEKQLRKLMQLADKTLNNLK